MEDTQDNKILKTFLAITFIVLIYFVGTSFYDSLREYKKEVDFMEAQKVVYRSYVDYPNMEQVSQKLFKFLARGKDKDSVASVLSVLATDSGVKVESIDFLDSFQADSSRVKIISDGTNVETDTVETAEDLFGVANIFMPNYQKMSVAINVTGGYDNINSFLQRIEQNSRYYDVQLFDFKQGSDNSGNTVLTGASANIVFNIYYQG